MVRSSSWNVNELMRTRRLFHPGKMLQLNSLCTPVTLLRCTQPRAYSAGTQYFRLSIRRRARRTCSIISRPISPDPLHALKARVSDLRPRHAAGHQPIRRIDIEACSSPIKPTIVTFVSFFFWTCFSNRVCWTFKFSFFFFKCGNKKLDFFSFSFFFF